MVIPCRSECLLCKFNDTLVHKLDDARALLAISLGLSRLYPNDEELLPRGFLLYDALYEWLQHAKSERHSWNPQRVPTPA
jgi:hypothetical protein